MIACLAAPIGAQTAVPGADARMEMLFWESVMNSNDRAQYAAYLARFPNGAFAVLARLKIEAIDRAAGTPAPAATPAPPAAPVPVAAAIPPAPPRPETPRPQTAVASPPAPPPTAGAAGLSNADLIARLGRQDTQAFTPADAVAASIPAAPTLAPLPDASPPARFCSAEQRNSFHETIFLPAKQIANENYQRTLTHTQEIQDVYERYAAQHDSPAMTIVAREAAAYQPVTQQAFQASSAFVGRFDALMAVPIGDCR